MTTDRFPADPFEPLPDATADLDGAVIILREGGVFECRWHEDLQAWIWTTLRIWPQEE
jgi:hypothetical protein